MMSIGHQPSAQGRHTMSEQIAEVQETAKQRRDQGEQAAPDLATLATLDENAEDLPDEIKAAFAALDEKQRAELDSMRAVAAVQGFTVTESGEFRNSSQPVRNRKPVQLAMDGVAQQAYADWVDAGRPSTWQRMPVITYFIDPDTEDGHGSLSDYRRWIRAAVLIAVPTPYEKDGETIEPSGVRARFGKEFTLTPKMAEKIGKPEEAGKTVLAWAAIDKRKVRENGE